MTADNTFALKIPGNERNSDVPSIGTETDQILACRQTKHNVVYRLAKFPQKQNLVNLAEVRRGSAKFCDL